MPPVFYFASYHKTPPRQQKEYKNNEQPSPQPASNYFLRGLRFLSGRRHKVEIREDVLSIHDQYNTLGDLFKVKDL